MYERPYNTEEIKKNYPDKADFLMNDPVHRWRAETGIELIHKEPTLEEQKRIWRNWLEMTDDMKEESDRKSLQLFDKDNESNNQEIMKSWSEVDFKKRTPERTCPLGGKLSTNAGRFSWVVRRGSGLLRRCRGRVETR
ncbi:MAG: hypothetical protein HZA95_02730 [Candidatus Vogelbacteria bacterium]|nr:hypothetical protein [Candidatus Vogelbacteria bacterium]